MQELINTINLIWLRDLAYLAVRGDITKQQLFAEGFSLGFMASDIARAFLNQEKRK